MFPISCFLLTPVPWGRKSKPLSFMVLLSLPLPQFSSQSLVAIDDDNWLEHLVRVVLEKISYFSDDDKEKVRLGVWWLQGNIGVEGRFRGSLWEGL